MALDTSGKNVIAEKLHHALSSTGGDTGFAYLFVMDSTYTTGQMSVTTSTTGYVSYESCLITSSGNTVSLASTNQEIEIPTGESVKYLLAISRNADYASVPFAENTTVSATEGTPYTYGGKFVVTNFDFEVN